MEIWNFRGGKAFESASLHVGPIDVHSHSFSHHHHRLIIIFNARNREFMIV